MTFQLPFAGNYPKTLDYGSQLPTAFGGGIFQAIDFGVPSGTPILASGAGKVISEKYDFGAGNMITILHNNGIETVYGHLAGYTVKTGDIVKEGQQIGLSGNTGKYTTGPHLLFGAKELLPKSPPVNINPLSLINDTKNMTIGQFESLFPNAALTPGNQLTADQAAANSGLLGGIIGIPGAIGDAAFTFGFIFLGAIILLAGVLLMRSKND